MATSRFWEQLGDEHRQDLESHGFDLVKRRQALRYFTWRWRPRMALKSEQFRFLLRHSGPVNLARSVTPPTRKPEWQGVDWTLGERWFYSFATRLLWQYASRHGHRQVLDLGEPLTGSPLPVRRRGQLVSQDLANSALEVQAMRRHIDGAPRHIVEIGAGYGRMAFALLCVYPSAKYTVIDIEPALSISRWYLSTFFPAARLTFLPADRADELEEADLAISISSLQEMTHEAVNDYLGLLDRRVRGLVYLKQWTTWKNPTDKVTLTFDEYPVPKRWRLLDRAQAPVQTNFTQAIWRVVP